MKKNRMLMSLISSFILLLFVTGCGRKDTESSLATSGSSAEETSTKRPGKLRALALGKAEEFAILAYSNISSIPTSSINGKVGLMPGTRDMIKLNPSEVAGGVSDIMAADDETNPPNLLSNAKVDMVTAYNKAAALIPDADKTNFDSAIGGKKLSPGVYKWSGDLSIADDFSVEGDENAVWIFKIAGHLRVSDGVKMIMNGGSKASNIFWQVNGSAILRSMSEMSGTIIAQQFIELGSKSVLNGRAFAKNGHVSANQATVTRPQ